MNKPSGVIKTSLGELIAFCGVNCETCPDYKNKLCPSCRKSVWEENDECMPVKCCRERKINCCGKCGGFPCDDMREFYEESESHKRAYERMSAIGCDQ